jgi:hypothetical protein
MNSNSFDLDIDHYSIIDLENFLFLENDYKVVDILEKSRQFKNKMANLNDNVFKDRIHNFLKEAESILTEHVHKNRVIPAGSRYIIDEYKPPVTNFVSQVYPTEIAPGLVSRLKKKTIINTFAINTLFRDHSNGTMSGPTDCLIILPYTIKDVVSMKLVSVELPQAIYLISQSSNSNAILIREYVGSGFNEQIVIIPDGNYDAFALATLLTTTINTTMGSGVRFNVTIDPNTYRTTITNSTYIFEMSIKISEMPNAASKSLGWILGYRQLRYINLQSYTSESIFNQSPTDYLFLEINDFNYSNSSRLVGLFSESYLDKNIIAKIPYGCNLSPLTVTTNAFPTLFINDDSIISSDRQYFGPIHLQKIAIRLLNRYGNVVDLNLLDFSFTLEMNVLYEL